MNKKNFDMMMNKFAKVYERALAPDVLKIYFNLCSEISDSQVNTIIRNCLKKCHYFPRPADIFESYDQYAIGSHKMGKITLTEEEREKNIQRIRKAKEELNEVKVPTRISKADLNIINYKEKDKIIIEEGG